MIKTYSELISYNNFIDRFHYLKLIGEVGKDTFGLDRYLNQTLYRSYKWRMVRDKVIVRDNACDLGMEGYDIFGKIIVHHINPLTLEQIEDDDPIIYDPEFLICVSHITHNAIHYGDENLLPRLPVERVPNDTCPWK